ncbi:MAG: hypothetical protein AB8B95_15280 [Pseudohongiellaceae bacterium]
MFNRGLFLLVIYVGLTTVDTVSFADSVDGEELVDPTIPLAVLIDEESEIDLTALFQNIVPENFDLSFTRASNINPIAVINNMRVTEGDMIGGATVLRISRSSVTLLIQDEEREIGLYDTSVKRAVLPQ